MSGLFELCRETEIVWFAVILAVWLDGFLDARRARNLRLNGAAPTEGQGGRSNG